VRGCFYVNAGVCYSNRQPARAHHGKIDNVVADVGNFFERQIFLFHDLAHGIQFMRLTHVDIFKPKVACSQGNGF
jgi:hypothetical protein